MDSEKINETEQSVSKAEKVIVESVANPRRIRSNATVELTGDNSPVS